MTLLLLDRPPRSVRPSGVGKRAPAGYVPHPSETDPGQLALVAGWLEEDLDVHIRRLALVLGYFPYHTRHSLRSEGGFPDWLLLRPPRLVVIEAKRQGLWLTPPRQSRRGRWSIGQAEWLRRWARQPGTECYLLWPTDAIADLAALLQAGPREDMACVHRTRAALEDAPEGGANDGAP